MACEVLLSDTARHQRDAIILFLMEDARATQRASALIDELDEVIARLAAYPEFYPLARDEKLARNGYRKANAAGYIVLHRHVDNRVYITNIFHERQDYARLV